MRSARDGVSSPVAMGDEQGGSYHPQALLDAGAVDVLRIDATTNGGVTRFAAVLAQAEKAGVAVSPHMFPHFTPDFSVRMVSRRPSSGASQAPASTRWTTALSSR